MYSWRLWNNRAANNSRVSDFFCACKHISNVFIPISIINPLELHITIYKSHWRGRERKEGKKKKETHGSYCIAWKLSTVKIKIKRITGILEAGLTDHGKMLLRHKQSQSWSNPSIFFSISENKSIPLTHCGLTAGKRKSNSNTPLPPHTQHSNDLSKNYHSRQDTNPQLRSKFGSMTSVNCSISAKNGECHSVPLLLHCDSTSPSLHVVKTSAKNPHLA